MAPAVLVRLAGFEQLLLGVEANGLEEPVPPFARIVAHHAALDERTEHADDVGMIASADPLERVETNRTVEDRE